MTKVKLKDIDAPECIKSPRSLAFWQSWRGKEIIIGRISENRFSATCNSDIEWEVLSKEFVEQIQSLTHIPKVTVCRHMIEAGD